GGEGFFDTGEELRPIAPEKIESAGFDQTFDDLAVGDSRIHPTTEIFQRSEVPSPLPLRNRGRHRAFSDIFDCGQAVADGTRRTLSVPLRFTELGMTFG